MALTFNNPTMDNIGQIIQKVLLLYLFMPRLKQSICKTHSLALVQMFFKNLSLLRMREN